MAANTCIETYTGRQLDLAHPDINQISLEDIAIGLSRQPRFLGMTIEKQAYCVAQHSLLGVTRLERMNAAFKLRIGFLLHDAHEAYTGDISGPMKQLLDFRKPISRLESKLQHTIHKALRKDFDHFTFVLTEQQHQLIKDVDEWAREYEAFHLMRSAGKGYAKPVRMRMTNDECYERFAILNAGDAYSKFLAMYEVLKFEFMGGKANAQQSGKE